MTFKEIVRKTEALNDQSSPLGLVWLVDRIRPPKNNLLVVNQKLQELIDEIYENPKERQSFIAYMHDFVCSKHSIQLFTDSGIQSGKGFFTEAFDRLYAWFLPPIYGETDHTKNFGEIFRKNWDHKWINVVPLDYWVKLFNALEIREMENLAMDSRMINQLLNSVLVVSQRVAAMGLDPEILRKLPELEEFKSPYVVQNKEIFDYLDRYQEDENFERTDQNPDYKHIQVMLTQCQDYVQLIRKNKRRFGADIISHTCSIAWKKTSRSYGY